MDLIIEGPLIQMDPEEKMRLLSEIDDLEKQAQEFYAAQVAAEPKIKIIYNAEIEEIIGSDVVEAVRYLEKDTRSSKILEVSGVFIYVGLQPNTKNVEGLVKLDETGRILVGRSMCTDVPGLLSIGSIRAGSNGRAAGAAEDATVAIKSAAAYISHGAWQI